MKKFEVLFSTEAEQDLYELYKYVAFNDSKLKANHLLEKLEARCLSLELFPERGHTPKELRLLLGESIFKEIFESHYRIIYQFNMQTVVVHCILDRRRELGDSLLHCLTRTKTVNSTEIIL